MLYFIYLKLIVFANVFADLSWSTINNWRLAYFFVALNPSMHSRCTCERHHDVGGD